MDFDWVIVECPGCRLRFTSWDEQSALDAYNRHKCLTDEEQVNQILDKILKENRSVFKGRNNAHR